MSSSPKSKRQPPRRTFEEYVLTYVVSEDTGFMPVSNDQMTYVPGTAGTPGFDDGFSIIPIGFPFSIEDVTYSNLYVNTNGWATLIDPATSQSSFNTAQVLLTSVYVNSSILSVFNYKHVLLCPWFDDLRNTYNKVDLTDSNLVQYLTDAKKTASNLLIGRESYPAGIEANSGGIKYFSGVSSSDGRYLCVRWKSFSYYIPQRNIVQFELVLYENGTIEFRYRPKIVLGTPPVQVSATVGIFIHGGTSRYRDFGFELKKPNVIETRQQYKYGGAVYDGSFVDTDDVSQGSPGSAPYISSLREDLHWPGQESFGAMFRFSPPQNRMKVKRNITMFRDSVPFLGGHHTEFDDQNVITFTTQSIEYPTMIPSQFITVANYAASDGVARLFQSGSIQITRAITPGMFDSVLSDSLVEAAKRMK